MQMLFMCFEYLLAHKAHTVVQGERIHHQTGTLPQPLSLSSEIQTAGQLIVKLYYIYILYHFENLLSDFYIGAQNANAKNANLEYC